MIQDEQAASAEADPSVQGLQIEFSVHFQSGSHGRKQLATGSRNPGIPTRKKGVPRISRLMALAIHFEGLLASGKIQSQGELARIGHVSRARVTQILNLLNLTPEIQEELLLPIAALHRLGSACEREIRRIVKEPAWQRQQFLWKKLKGQDRSEPGIVKKEHH